MTKRKPQTANPRTDQRSTEQGKPDAISRHIFPSQAAIRETIESIVIAFILAFLFRTFEAEAFVIPTGSMAPTLMGRHKEFACPKCGFQYQINAHDEVNDDGSLKSPPVRVAFGTCPICRYTADIGPGNPQRENYPSFSGDRLLVEKFAYEIDEPKRWDVIVFKFPGDATTDSRTNFIKRLVGLPGETVRLKYGDVWVRRGEEPFVIARKPPEKLLAMLQPVFDNDCMPKIAACGLPARWRTEQKTGGWLADDQAGFHIDAKSGEHWLRYRHLVPSHEQWEFVDRGGKIAKQQVPPQFIRDFTAYNTNRNLSGDNVPDPTGTGQYWVGDLALKCTAELQNDKGELLFELRKGGRMFHCRFDIATGQATLSISGSDMAKFHPTAKTAVQGPGRHNIMFSNCDDELRLWVDGRVVQFDACTAYKNLGNTLPDETDLSPVGVASIGASVKLTHLNILRDLFYIPERNDNPGLFAAAANRLYAAEVADGGALKNSNDAFADFVMEKDQFFALGDNSARSKDGRFWGPNNHFVPRNLLIGKAVFIYWPHSWDQIPYTKIPFPFFPNFAKMGLVK